MCRDARLIEIALANTQLSKHNFPMASLIARGSRIISIGVNKTKTHPKQKSSYTEQCTSVHAEISALLGCNEEQLDGATVYVARRLANGQAALAKPCKTCHNILRQVGVKKMVYTIPNGYASEKLI